MWRASCTLPSDISVTFMRGTAPAESGGNTCALEDDSGFSEFVPRSDVIAGAGGQSVGIDAERRHLRDKRYKVPWIHSQGAACVDLGWNHRRAGLYLVVRR
jgi:hypothetical protein